MEILYLIKDYGKVMWCAVHFKGTNEARIKGFIPKIQNMLVTEEDYYRLINK